MMSASLKQRLYWQAPYWVRCWMASRYARQRDVFRYGEIYEQAVAVARLHERWTPQQFLDYQVQQLRKLVAHAAEHVPYYRRLFAEHRIQPSSIQDLSDLKRIPVLEKEPIRAAPADLVDERYDVRNLLLGHTSGTTGTPVLLYRRPDEESMAFAYLDARWHSVIGVCRRTSRSVSIGGHAVASPSRTKPPFWVHNRHWNQLYVSSYHLSPKYLDHIVKAIRDFAPEYVEGYPSSVYAVAAHIVGRGLPPIQVKGAFTTAETLFDYQRQAIRKAFGCKTYNQYGCGEAAVFAAECEHGSMHLSPEVGIVEVVDENGQPVAPGQPGQILGTSLMNYVQPFIRYRLGDTVSLKEGTCSCGRQLPMLCSIEGRTDDVLITSDGRRLGLAHLSLVFYDIEGILETQFVQDSRDHFRIRVVPAGDYTDDVGKMLAASLRQRVGQNADIRIEVVDHLERTARGKLRMILSNIPKIAR